MATLALSVLLGNNNNNDDNQINQSVGITVANINDCYVSILHGWVINDQPEGSCYGVRSIRWSPN